MFGRIPAVKYLTLFLAAVLILASCGRPTDAVPASGDEVKVETASLKDSEPVFMSYAHGGRQVRFFVVKVGGRVQSYFDACMKCYPRKLGYRSDKGRLFCRACDEWYPAERLEGVGSCYPIRLEGKAVGGHYVIRKEDIAGGEKYF
jgi:uncharacterized membrane protein